MRCCALVFLFVLLYGYDLLSYMFLEEQQRHYITLCSNVMFMS